MKKWLVLPLAIIALLALPIGASAANSESGGDSHHFGPFASSSPDGGTCSPWAQDTFNRVFTVKENEDGTFTVREDFTDGRFVTTGPRSPGGCETTDTHHGSTVLPGIHGVFGGYLNGTVTGGSFNPNGCTAPALCDSTAGFIAATFGPTAQYSCSGGPGVCRFAFLYHAHGQGLIYHFWVDASDRNGVEFFKGDIATS